MSVRVDDQTLTSAIAAAHASADIAHGDLSQWAGIERYAATRGPDPTPTRAAEIAAIMAVGPEVAYQAAAQFLLEHPGSSPLRDLFVRWAREDFATAEPLLAVFTGHGTDVEHPTISVDPREIELLAGWLSDQYGSPVTIARAEVIGGGFSRRMWRVTLSVHGLSRNVVVRVEQGGMFGTRSDTEVMAMRGLLAAGYRVPEIVHVEATGEVLGEPFFIMEEVRGEVRLDDEGLNDIIRSVDQLHRVPITAIETRSRTPEQVISDNIDGWLSLYREHAQMPIPLIEQGAGWLREHLKPTGPSVIVHGDAGPGNALFDPEQGLTVLDWEFAHVGDAAEDWAYLALIRGRRTMSPQAWKHRLTDTVGLQLTDEQWRDWLAYNHFRGACVNLTALTVFRQGRHRTADQLAIGIAVHLRFLGQLIDITCA